MTSYSKQDLRQRQLLDISEVIETASRHHFLLPSLLDSDHQWSSAEALFFEMMFYGVRWTVNERLFFLVTGVAAGCSTLTRNAVTHGLDPEVRKCLKIGNIIKEFLKLFCCRLLLTARFCTIDYSGWCADHFLPFCISCIPRQRALHRCSLWTNGRHNTLAQ